MHQRAIALGCDEIIALPEPGVIKRRDTLGLLPHRHAREATGALQQLWRIGHALGEGDIGHLALIRIEPARQVSELSASA